jgi:hypothetical protein
MKTRQRYFSENRYEIFLKEHDEVTEFFTTKTFKSDFPEGEATLRSRFFQRLALRKLLAAYTAGEEMPSLAFLLEDLVDKYEIRQAKLAKSEQSPDISPLAIDDWPHEYEECTSHWLLRSITSH